jgi:hypothetical protein
MRFFLECYAFCILYYLCITVYVLLIFYVKLQPGISPIAVRNKYNIIFFLYVLLFYNLLKILKESN